MAKVITDNQHYADIAAAIRTKNETETLYKPSEMAPAILAIQGGVELNFKVVGGETEPVDPAENTILVNTPEEITSWIFSAEEPEGPEPGAVWFTVGLQSPVEFNALKENNIQVYPLYAKQYVDGAWVDKTAKIYQNGKWFAVLPKGVLFYNGQENEFLTGGIIFINGSSYPTMGTGSKGNDAITLTVGHFASIMAVTDLVDLTEYDKLTVDISKFTVNNSNNFVELGVSIDRGAESVVEGNNILAKIRVSGTGKCILPIADIDQKAYCYVRIWSWDTFNGTASVEFTDWRLE